MDAADSIARAVSLPASLADARIHALPAAAYYIADFISEDEEKLILEKIAAAPKPRWKVLTHRRLQTWPSDLVKDSLLEADLPPWLEEPVIPRLLSLLMDGGDQAKHLFSSSPHQRPKHVLINEYPPGVGIMPHKDGAAYYPVVCTVSLGSSLCLNIHQTKPDGAMDPDPVGKILQEPRSLLITTDALYTDYLHGIADVEEDTDLSVRTVANWDLLRSPGDLTHGRNVRGLRTSLTYRDVLRVSSLGKKLKLLHTR